MSARPGTLEQAELYATWLQRGGVLSDNTKKVYEARVRSFTQWLIEQGRQYDDALTDEHVRDYACRDYRRKLLTLDKRAESTVAQTMSALKSFYEWLELGAPRGVSVDVPPSKKEGLTEDQLRWLLRATQRRGVRDFAIASTLFYAGPRVSELAALDVDDVVLHDRKGQLSIRYGKGGQPRKVELNAPVRAALRDWMRERHGYPGAGTSPLWLSRSGERLAVRSIQDMLAKAGNDAGVKVTPHVLRHTFGRISMDKGTDIVTLQQMLGHKDPRTTAGYAKPGERHFRDAVDRLAVEL